MVKRQDGLYTLVPILAMLIGGGCRDNVVPSSDAATPNRSIAVSSPYIEVAIRDVLLLQEVPMVRLAGPSMCPGHFDMRPSQINELARCRLLVRFDFQRALDEKVADRTSRSLETLVIVLPDGMCVPEAYLAACRQIADHLVSTGDLEWAEADRRLAEIADRMTALADEVRPKIDAAGLRDVPVLTSGHQTGFCRWLGLRSAASFSAGVTAGAGEIDGAVKAGEAEGVKIIVANEPEGRRLADALADRFDAQVVVFANFPEPDETPAFDNLVRRNLTALLKTGHPVEEKP